MIHVLLTGVTDTVSVEILLVSAAEAVKAFLQYGAVTTDVASADTGAQIRTVWLGNAVITRIASTVRIGILLRQAADTAFCTVQVASAELPIMIAPYTGSQSGSVRY